jgi:hypothetical protein
VGTSAPKATTPTEPQTVAPTSKPPAKPPAPAQLAGPLRFGPIAPGTSYDAGIDVSEDRQAFSLGFSFFEIGVGNGKQTPAVVSRSFPLVVPLTGAPRKATVEFHTLGWDMSCSTRTRPRP